jgi:predicted transcriptional regulator
MEDCKLFDGEYKFIRIIWEVEPIGSMELVRLAYERLGWKKSTTFTMLRRMCDRGLARNEKSVVTSIVKREQARQYEAEALLEKMFDDSLPSFIASFLQGKTLSADEAEEIGRLIKEAAK